LDGDGRIALTNRRFEELLQLPAEYLLGKRLTGLHADLARLFAEPDVIAAGMRDANGKARAQWTAAQRWPEERQLQFTFSAPPLASIIGFVDLLRADAAPNLTAQQQEYLAFVHFDALYERDVIEQLLEVL